MIDARRYLGPFAIASLVLLRLVVGWHFFTQGLDKIDYDRHEGRVRMIFSADGFLGKAKGPLAGLFHSQAPNGYDWSALLAVPRQNVPLPAEDVAERSRWNADYQKRRAEAAKNNEAVPSEFPPYAPYYDWAARVVSDWENVLARVMEVPGLSDEQRRSAGAALALRKQELADFLADENDAIVDYQHQLWRLANWKAAPEADGLPYQGERIAAKSAEATRASQPWVGQVAVFEELYLSDLAGILTPEQQSDATMSASMTEARALPGQRWLNFINVAVTVLTIGVGICLLLGLFTRFAATAGALFLLAVIASQPAWLPESISTINQAIEMAGLLVLAGTGAGRWLGLDFFTYALFGRHDKTA